MVEFLKKFSAGIRIGKSERKIVLSFILFTTFWILLSDIVEPWVLPNRSAEFWATVVKGLAFIACTSFLLLFLLIRESRERRRTADRLRQTNEQVQTLVEMSVDPILLLDREGRIHSLNGKAGAIFENLGTLGKGLVLELPENTGQPFEVRFPDAEGRSRTYEIRLSEVHHNQGDGYMATLRDVTERKKTVQDLLLSQAALQNQFQELEQIYRFAPVGLFVIDERYRFVRINELLAKMNRLPVDYHIGQHVFDLLPHLEDQLAPIFDSVLERGEAVLGVEIVDENPRAEGGSTYRLGNYFPLQGTTGGVSGVVGAIIDITELKTAEEKLKLANLALSNVRSALDQTSLVFITGPDGIILEINDKYCELTGYSRDQIVGRNPRILNSGHHSREFFAEMWRTILAGRVWSGEVRNRARDGREFWVDATCVPILDTEGKPAQFISIMNDITERKMAERMFQNIATGVSVQVGPEFFPSLVLNLAHAIRAEGAFLITVGGPENAELKTVSVCREGRMVTELEGITLARGNFPSGWLSEEGKLRLGWNGRIPTPFDDWLASKLTRCRELHDTSGVLVGLLGVVFDAPRNFIHREQVTLEIFAAQAEAELERQRISTVLKKLNQGLELRVNERTRELERVNRELRGLTGLQQAILDGSNYAIITADLEGIVRMFNPAAERILGYRAERVVNAQSFLVFLDSGEVARRADELTERIGRTVSPDFSVFRTILETGLLVEEEWACVRGDETRFPALISISPIQPEGGPATGCLAILADMTDQKEAAELLRNQAEEKNRANQMLLRVSRMKDEFIASVSHELRTPLNAILGLSESIREGVYGDVSDRVLRPVATIEESGNHLLNLINDILDVAKVESGKMEAEVSRFSVRATCESVLRLVREQAVKKNLKLRLSISDDRGTLVSDQRRVKQILVNLLGNAVKFTPPGKAVGLDVLWRAQNEEIEFSVWDEGIGIPENVIPNLFQPFVQLDSRLSRQFEGTGLGLSLVDGLTRLLGGRVEVQSTVNVGSRFTVILPTSGQRVEEIERTLHAPPRADVDFPRHLAGQPKILVAEDNQQNVGLLVDYLESKGFDVLVARDGVEALEVARIQVPDLILMDLQMPRMDGLECTRQLREEDRTLGIPVIALTALAREEDRRRCLEVGMNDYVSKPVSLSLLVEKILLHLGLASGGAE